MRIFSMAGLLGLAAASAFAATHPDRVRDFYETLYPSDPYKREALELCFARDHAFNRADPEAREACYRQVLAGPVPVSARELPPPRVNEPNFIDLYRAQGQGHAPKDDVRYQQQNDRYLHPGAR